MVFICYLRESIREVKSMASASLKREPNQYRQRRSLALAVSIVAILERVAVVWQLFYDRQPTIESTRSADSGIIVVAKRNPLHLWSLNICIDTGPYAGWV